MLSRWDVNFKQVILSKDLTYDFQTVRPYGLKCWTSSLILQKKIATTSFGQKVDDMVSTEHEA